MLNLLLYLKLKKQKEIDEQLFIKKWMDNLSNKTDIWIRRDIWITGINLPQKNPISPIHHKYRITIYGLIHHKNK